MAEAQVEIDDDDFYYSAEERKRLEENPEPTIVEASYHADSGIEFLHLKMSNGQRMLIPKEMLGELKDANPQQAADVEIFPGGLHLWWPQLDDGLYLPDFLEHRWCKVWTAAAA